MNMTEWLHFHALEKEMATHSSVLGWRIPGTGEPGGLPSMGSHGVAQSRTRLKRLSSSSSSSRAMNTYWTQQWSDLHENTQEYEDLGREKSSWNINLINKHCVEIFILTLWLKALYMFLEEGWENIHLKDNILWKHSAKLTFNLCTI